MTSAADAVTWRELLHDTATAVGDRTRARWLCEVASGSSADELLAQLDEPATTRMVAFARSASPSTWMVFTAPASISNSRVVNEKSVFPSNKSPGLSGSGRNTNDVCVSSSRMRPYPETGGTGKTAS